MTSQATSKKIRPSRTMVQIRISFLLGVVWSSVALALAFSGLGVTAFWLTIVVAGIIDTFVMDRVGRQYGATGEQVPGGVVAAPTLARQESHADPHIWRKYDLGKRWLDLGRLRLPRGKIFVPSRRWWALSAHCAMSSLVTLNATPFIFLALPTIGQHFDASLVTLQWVATGYFLAFGALHTISVPITNTYGGRRVFQFGASLIVISSLLAATAGSLSLLIGYRVVQGIGAALATQAGNAIVDHAFAPDGDRKRALGRVYLTGYASRLLGPLLGGLLIFFVGWRWIFYVSVPFAALAIIVVRFAMPRPQPSSKRGVSVYIVPGYAFVTILGFSLLGCLLVTSEWSTDFAFVGVLAVVVFASLGAAWLFAVHGWRSPTDYRFFSSRAFIGANLAGFTASFLSAPTLLYVVIFLTTVRGYTSLQTGAALCVAAAGTSITFASIKRLSLNVRPRFQLAVALCVLAIGLLFQSMVTTSTSYVILLIPLAVIGMGSGLVVMPAFFAIRVSAPRTKKNIASSIVSMSGVLGAALGIATLTSNVAYGQGRVSHQISTLSGHLVGEHFIRALQDSFLRGSVMAFIVAVLAYMLIKDYDKQPLSRDNRADEEMIPALTESLFT